MLTPVTALNTGRVPRCVQPVSKPAPKAPFSPPPEIARISSRGPAVYHWLVRSQSPNQRLGHDTTKKIIVATIKQHSTIIGHADKGRMHSHFVPAGTRALLMCHTRRLPQPRHWHRPHAVLTVASYRLEFVFPNCTFSNPNPSPDQIGSPANLNETTQAVTHVCIWNQTFVTSSARWRPMPGGKALVSLVGPMV